MTDSHLLAAAATTRAIIQHLFGPPAGRSFTVRLWDGTVEGPEPNRSTFTVVFHRPGALRRMLLPPSELGMAEAYLRNDFDVEGDVEAATGMSELVAERIASPVTLFQIGRLLRQLPADDLPADVHTHAHNAGLRGGQHTKRRDAAAVRSHYDVGNDFYALWLDRRMVYSCAYFRHPDDDLDTAQEAKLDLICRKLRLRPGERLLDIGSGWGGLIQFAAENYGVRATGITLSEPQAELARMRIRAAGVADRCRVEVRDYRDMRGETFDKIVSVGMYEHVGRARMRTYFDQAMKLLVPGGLFLNHGIVEGPNQFSGLMALAMRHIWTEGAFVQKYVFPDGDIIRPGIVVNVAEEAGFETRDVENLREHYALTLRHWVDRLERHHDEAVRIVGEETYRVWRLYMSASARGFATARVGLVQTLLSKTERSGVAHLPMTREDIYRDVPTLTHSGEQMGRASS